MPEYRNPNMNPQMNPASNPELFHDNSGNMQKLLAQIDEICTLSERGSEFHKHVANELNMAYGLRGYAWLHRPEYIADKKWIKDFEKIVADKLHHHAKKDRSMMHEIDNYKVNNMQTFEKSFSDWIDYEEELCDAINVGIELSKNIDWEIYQCLFAKAKDIHEEIMRAKNVQGNLKFNSFHPHHVTVVSKWIHAQREANPDSLDINIG